MVCLSHQAVDFGIDLVHTESFGFATLNSYNVFVDSYIFALSVKQPISVCCIMDLTKFRNFSVQVVLHQICLKVNPMISHQFPCLTPFSIGFLGYHTIDSCLGTPRIFSNQGNADLTKQITCGSVGMCSF